MAAATDQGRNRTPPGLAGAPRRVRATRAAALALALLALPTSGCGKKGDPEPPLRIVPAPTRALAVTQRGEQLLFRLPYPETTTAGAVLPGLEAVEVWEMTRPLPDPAAELPGVDLREFQAAARRLVTLRGPELQSAIEGGQIVTRQPLPAAPGDAPQLRVYGVRTVAAGGEASAWSNLVRLVLRTPPAPPVALQVMPRERGVELTWRAPEDGLTGFRVYRRQAASRSYGPPLATLGADARSYLDETAAFGERYIYTVTALGAGEPAVESALGEEREVAYEDRFPPAPPQELLALPEVGAVRLVWQPSPDADAIGYHVYRQDPGAELRRLTDEPLAALQYTDSGLTSGLVFRYQLTAVDAAGNEGPPTPAVEARVR